MVSSSQETRQRPSGVNPLSIWAIWFDSGVQETEQKRFILQYVLATASEVIDERFSANSRRLEWRETSPSLSPKGMSAFGPAWKAALVFALLSFAAPPEVSGKRTKFSEDSRHLRRRRRSLNNLKLDGNRIDLITPSPLSLPNSGDVATHIPFVTPTPTQTKVWSSTTFAPSLKASLNSAQVTSFPYTTPHATLYEAPSTTPLSSLPPSMPLPTQLSPSKSDPSSEGRLRWRKKRRKRLNKKFMRLGKADAKSVFAESDGAMSVMTGVTDESPSFLIDSFLQVGGFSR